MTEARITPGKILYHLLCPLLRAEDIAILYDVHPATVRRYLQGLTEQGYVESVEPGTIANSQHTYYLTHKGVVTVARHLRSQPEAEILARATGADELSILRLLPRLSTLITAQNFIRHLALRAPEMITFSDQHRTKLNLHWVRDWHRPFQRKGRWERVDADAAVTLVREGRDVDEPEVFFPFFLLADGGLSGYTDRAVIEQKLKRLLLYRESTERRAHYAEFPPVVIIVPEPHQREHWQRVALEVTADLRVDPMDGVIACVPPHQPDVSAWTLAWQDLNHHNPCRLQDYLKAVDAGALPEGFLTTLEQMPQANAKPPRLPKSADALIVRGQYARRPKHDGNEVAWLGMKLSHRDKKMLNTLYAAPLLSTEEVAAFFDMSEPTAARALYDLQQEGCIEREGTEAGKRWRLSVLGLRLMAAMLHLSIQHVAEWVEESQVQRGILVLRRSMQHTAGVYGFLARLHQAAAEQGHRIIWWESGAWCERRYHDQSGWRNLRPDAALEYRTESRRIRLWLEWDRGQMGGSALEKKFFAYAHYVRSREWARELRPLPALLVVTSDPAHEQRIQRIARSCAQAGLIVQTTTASRLDQQGPLAPIWLSSVTGKQQPIRQSWLSSDVAEQPVPVSSKAAGGYVAKG